MYLTRTVFLFMLLMPVLLLPACGFHLRGAMELPPVLEVTYIQSNKPFQGISQVLRRQLSLAGATVAEKIGEATGVIDILDERSERRILSVGSTGRATQYELFEEVRFALSDKDGNQILKPQAVSMVRALTFDENELLGKVTEAEKLQRQMRQDLARQIITRINVSALKL